MKWLINNLDELAHCAAELAKQLPYGVVVFQGQMGAGKTTLIKELCKVWGVEDHVSSPTFGFVNEYRTSTDVPVFHFDLYRLQSEEEAWDFGIEEYLAIERGWVLMEWAEKIPNLLPQPLKLVSIDMDGSNRVIVLSEVNSLV